MPWPTPFHERTNALCTSLAYKEWAGCHAVRRYDVYHEREYHALRQAVTVMDATPLYKYEVRGPGAAALLSRMTVRDFTRTAVGRVGYVVWCDEEGKVLDDGTVTRLDDRWFRLTSTEPSYAWLLDNARGLDVDVEDRSRTLGCLAVQGPRSRAVLREVLGAGIDELRFFRAQVAPFGDRFVEVTRTGYTGDLGYEVWVEEEHCLAVWDALFEAGAPHGILPLGLDALDVVRVEAGFVLGHVDYVSARHALIERQKSTPYELGFDWMVKLDREPFLGQRALIDEKEHGRARALVGLEIDWDDFEALHEEFDLPPHLAVETCREGVPLYRGGTQVGYATSRTWSPLLKKYLALGTVRADYATPGTPLEIEVTVEYERRRATATVRSTPFYDPEHKKA